MMKHLNKKYKWMALCGATFWLCTGLALSLRDAGNPPESFRKSADLMPLFALGLVMIGVSLGYRMLVFRGPSGGLLFKSVCQIVMISSLIYAFGVFIRQIYLQANGWEPLMPLGFVAFIISWACLGVLSLKKGFISRLPGFLLIASAIGLLSFNDQYNPYGAVVFGGLTILFLLSEPRYVSH